jgi:hypothetical protein
MRPANQFSPRSLFGGAAFATIHHGVIMRAIKVMAAYEMAPVKAFSERGVGP